MRRRSFMTTAALAMVLALPQTAGADDIEGSSDFVAATAATEQANLVHYQQVASQEGNISCRVEKPVFVSQPEIDGRITVKGEDDAESSAECVDIQLEAQDLIWGWLYVEWLKPGGDPNNPLDWNRVWDADTPCSGRMIKGVGACVAVLSYVFPANDPSQGRPHRACLDLDAPANFAAVCTTSPSLEKKTV